MPCDHIQEILAKVLKYDQANFHSAFKSEVFHSILVHDSNKDLASFLLKAP